MREKCYLGEDILFNLFYPIFKIWGIIVKKLKLRYTGEKLYSLYHRLSFNFGIGDN